MESETSEHWAQAILANHDYLTGWSLSRDWQLINGPLRRGHRLLPRKPFALGSEYAVENLVSVPSTTAMDLYGSLHGQIRDVHGGTQITVTGWL